MALADKDTVHSHTLAQAQGIVRLLSTSKMCFTQPAMYLYSITLLDRGELFQQFLCFKLLLLPLLQGVIHNDE